MRKLQLNILWAATPLGDDPPPHFAARHLLSCPAINVDCICWSLWWPLPNLYLSVCLSLEAVLLLLFFHIYFAEVTSSRGWKKQLMIVHMNFFEMFDAKGRIVMYSVSSM